ncbi:MAG: zinc ribbon domain-containing protein [Caldilineaceae bacterium]
MARYDASIITEFAQRLYDQANLVLLLFTIGGIVIGGGGGALLSPGIALIGALILGLIGYFIGQTRAFQLKLQAQMALCQVAIEENTRKLAEGAAFKSESLPSAQPSSATPIPVESKPAPLATPAKPASGSGRKCRECGAELPRAAEFCPKCLAQVT